jgi:hypothetical protein
VHQYLDSDGSGTHPGVVSATIGVERLTAITQWAEATGNRLFRGEVGVTADQTSLTALDLMLTYMGQHTDAWQGITYWAGGPWWGNYMFSIEPQNGVDKPQMAILVNHLSSLITSPTISGTVAGQTTTKHAPLQPFAGVTIRDPNNGATDTLTITLSDNGTTETLSGIGLSRGTNGVYTLAAASAATITSELQQLVFTPTAGAPSSTTTTFTLSNLSSADATATVNNTTSVIDFNTATEVAEDLRTTVSATCCCKAAAWWSTGLCRTENTQAATC